MKKVVVVIPIYKAIPTEIELISLNQCIKILGDHPISIVAPLNLDISSYTHRFNQLHVIRFNSYFFQNTLSYNRLLLSVNFYRSFKEYEFMLIYQLDAYVFRDELLDWCEKDYDYIGAPVHNFILDNFSQRIDIATLNGGFSLRKINSALRVLSSFRFIYSFKDLLKANIASNGRLIGFFKAMKFYLTGNNTLEKLNRYDRNEDYFWALICPKLFNWYTVASVNEALSFSFDNQPELSFEMASFKLPFGCHAFEKDNEFWKQLILFN